MIPEITIKISFGPDGVSTTGTKAEPNGDVTYAPPSGNGDTGVEEQFIIPPPMEIMEEATEEEFFIPPVPTEEEIYDFDDAIPPPPATGDVDGNDDFSIPPPSDDENDG